MASPQASMHLAANAAVLMYDHDPDATAATVTTPDGGTTERWVDMRDYGKFAVLAMPTNLSGDGITLLEIVAADDDSGTNVTQIKTSGTVAADAVGDVVFEECTAEEIAQESETNGYSLRYVAARLTVEDLADEAAVTYIRFDPRFARSGLTADTIS